ncbi:hypothetical protein OC846_002545 [Tilletia horrida]|uniref:RRM domain-containing protein n=1 Tax=Tilletia horrida TaxID=155126 RepID=A0AAN6GU79_9BASI|nr:hypothetical protein OC846_002545 [Tilletia horrida]KAK0554093.1 hypothetical protein OC845_000907 [Tilletia horrida]KAK0568135.1 hypothetical protein OC861_002226 [Tilletia horrida]
MAPTEAATANGTANGSSAHKGGQPNQSLYVKNIDSKIKKEELRKQLYALFGTYGRILDVTATRADGMRGQAFVVFQDLAGATAALRGLSGFIFYDRPLSIEYARTKSNAVIIQEKGREGLFEDR